ncbi:MAG: glycoside hydrolase family 43 protein, partial [Microbacterium sp.]
MGQQVYRNPVRRDGDFADPFVLRHDGRYYLYSTTPLVDCWTSDDLIHWRLEGPVLTPDVFPGLVPFAPEVVYADGAFFLYTSPSGHGHHVLRSDTPTGPFHDVTGNVGHAIDGNVLVDDDGRWYFYWAGDEGIWGCEMPSPTEFGEPVLTGIHMNGWTEGPFVSKRDGRYHMTLTGNHYLSAGYRIDAAHSDHPLTGWRAGLLNPIVVSTAADFRGLGHSSSVIGPDLVSTHLVYHNMNPDLTRHLNVDRQVWNGPELLVLGPSRQAPVPDPPTHRCDWTEAAAADGWVIEGGALRVEGRSALLSGVASGGDRGSVAADGPWGSGSGDPWAPASGADVSGADAPGADAPGSDVPRASARWAIGAVPVLTAELSVTAEQAASYGISVDEDGGRRVVFCVDRETGRVTVTDRGHEVGALPLPAAFVHEALHTWRIVADGTRFEVFLDGRRQTVPLAPLGTPAEVGVHVAEGAVRIGHCALTTVTPEGADRRAAVPVPGRFWAALTPDAGVGVGPGADAGVVPAAG